MLWDEIPRMQELTTDQVRDYLHSRKYERQTFFGIKSIYEWLFIDDYVEQNVCWRLDNPANRKTYPDYLSVEEIGYLLSVGDRRERTVIHLMYATGMRVGEVAQVRESDLMLESGMIKIHGKGNKERMGLMYPECVQHMEKWITIRNRAKLKTFWGDHPQKIFIQLRPKIQDEVLKAKMARPHILRHSFATHMVKGGADIMVVKELLGHEHVRDTEKYVHISGQQIRDAINIGMGAPRPKTKPRKFMTRKELKQAKMELKW
jgi:integrase/recombinase XerD